MLTICILILLAMYFHRPLGTLLDRLKQVNWEKRFAILWTYILRYGKAAGRATLRPLLLFYFVMIDDKTTLLDRALIYGCIAYVILPFSLLPRAVFKVIGVLDETAAIMFVYNRVHDKITPDMQLRADALLDEWFGPEYVCIPNTENN